MSALYISLQMTLNELLLPRMEKSLMHFPAFQKLEEVVVVAEATAIVAHSSRKANERVYTHERPGNHALAFILFIRKLSDFSESP